MWTYTFKASLENPLAVSKKLTVNLALENHSHYKKKISD